MDVLSPEQRRKCMASIRSKDTKPELAVRRLAHGLGYRYRLYRKDLPGRPDLIFPSRGKIIFVHGCFWHRHEGCRLASNPKTRKEYWVPKFERNVMRDLEVQSALSELGWDCLVIWECQTKDIQHLAERIVSYLD